MLAGAHHSHLATLAERQSRFTMLVKVPGGGKDTASVVPAVARQMRKLPTALRRSLTWDRGLENLPAVLPGACRRPRTPRGPLRVAQLGERGKRVDRGTSRRVRRFVVRSAASRPQPRGAAAAIKDLGNVRRRWGERLYPPPPLRPRGGTLARIGTDSDSNTVRQGPRGAGAEPPIHTF